MIFHSSTEWKPAFIPASSSDMVQTPSHGMLGSAENMVPAPLPRAHGWDRVRMLDSGHSLGQARQSPEREMLGASVQSLLPLAPRAWGPHF